LEHGAGSDTPVADLTSLHTLLHFTLVCIPVISIATLMFQFSPMSMVAQQQAIMPDTFTATLEGALE
jgi:hypothetical protein